MTDKVALKYSSVEELETRMKDLEKVQDMKVEALQTIMNNDQVSKRGTNRVLAALASYPRVPPRKLTNEYEAALLTLSLEIKELQLIRLLIATELGNRKTEAENLQQPVQQ